MDQHQKEGGEILGMEHRRAKLVSLQLVARWKVGNRQKERKILLDYTLDSKSKSHTNEEGKDALTALVTPYTSMIKGRSKDRRRQNQDYFGQDILLSIEHNRKALI